MEMVGMKENQLIKGSLLGFSQVVLIENKFSGALILLAIFIANWQLGLLALIASVVGTQTALLLKLDSHTISSGLFSFSPILVGIAAGTFFSTLPAMLVVAILGSILTVPVTVVINHLFSKAGLAGLTFPFILMTWLFVLVSFSSQLLNAGRSASLASQVELTENQLLLPDIFLKGVGEIFLLDNNIASIIILLAFFVAGVRQGLLALIAIVASLAMGLLFNVNQESLSMGLLTYNTILTVVALDLFLPEKKSPSALLYFILGICLTFLFDLAFPVILGTFALPTLTFPFVVATWLVLFFARQVTANSAD